MLRILLRQVGKGINRIARSRHLKLYIGSSKMKIIINCQLHHAEAIMLMGKRLSLLERILRTHHKPNLIQLGTIIKCLRNNQMSDMDGVE